MERIDAVEKAPPSVPKDCSDCLLCPTPSFPHDDAGQAGDLWMGCLILVTHGGMIASGGESVLGEVVCTQGKEIGVPYDLPDGQRRGWRLDHCAERRKVFDPHFVSGRHEQ